MGASADDLLPSADLMMEKLALAEAEKASAAMRRKAEADAEKINSASET